MANLNRVELMGRLAEEPRVLARDGGTSSATIRVITNHYYRDKEGERRVTTDSFWVRLYGQLATFAAMHLGKGSAVYVEGRLHTESWEDAKTKERKWGVVVIANDLQGLERRGSDDEAEEHPASQGGDATQSSEPVESRDGRGESTGKGSNAASQATEKPKVAHEQQDTGGTPAQKDSGMDPGSTAFETKFGLGSVPF